MSAELNRARAILAEYSCLTPKVAASSEEKHELQQALKLMVARSDWENLGICAESIAEARAALDRYLAALGYAAAPAIGAPPAAGPVYLKYNTQRQIVYCDRYDGEYRGVLVSCQSEDEAVAGTYGYLPLDLFAQAV